MAIKYKNQERLVAMTTNLGDSTSTYRMSEIRKIAYGGRGGKYDELQKLRNQQSDSRGVNEKLSDARIMSVIPSNYSSKRFDQIERVFFEINNGI